MKKNSSSFEAWYFLLAVLCVVAGVGLGVRWKVALPGELTALKVNAITFPVALVTLFSLITWRVTLMYAYKRQKSNEKDMARKAIKQAFELMSTAHRIIETIDMKSNAIIGGRDQGPVSARVAHEMLQGLRNQIVEVCHDLGGYIENWRDVLPEEFEKVEKNERFLGMLTTEQVIKTIKLKEIEKNISAYNEKEISALKADLVKLAEKQRITRLEAISESKKLVGAPVSVTSTVNQYAPAQVLLEHIHVQQLYLSKDYAKGPHDDRPPDDFVEV